MNDAEKQTDSATRLSSTTETEVKLNRVLGAKKLNKKAELYRKDDRAMRRIYGCHENFLESLSTPRLPLPKFLMGFSFDRSYECR